MALINCSECGYEFSDQAEGCPQCGCPNAPGGMTPISMPPEPKPKKRIPPEVRRALKSAAPFAGIALGATFRLIRELVAALAAVDESHEPMVALVRGGINSSLSPVRTGHRDQL